MKSEENKEAINNPNSDLRMAFQSEHIVFQPMLEAACKLFGQESAYVQAPTRFQGTHGGFNIYVVGDSKVGKTSLINKYFKGEFSE